MRYFAWAGLSLAERTRRRVTLHLIPYLFFLYILAFLDRANVSVAALGMERTPIQGGLGFDKATIGFGFGMFFWGYWILEIPSTVSVVKRGARTVFARILVLWGLSCALIGTIGSPLGNRMFSWLPVIPTDTGTTVEWLDSGVDFLLGWAARSLDGQDSLAWFATMAEFFNHLSDNAAYQFYFFRFMLGFFEGGFFPSVIVYLSLWFRAEDRAKAIASFMAAIPLSLIIGSPLSGAMLHIDWGGLAGWRWIFILQGIAPVAAGLATLFLLPDRPEKAAWLPQDERDWLIGELAREHQSRLGHGHWMWLRRPGVVLLLTAAYLCQVTVSYGLVTFLPKMIQAHSGVTDLWASVITAVPYLAALAAMLANGWHSDHVHERTWHVIVPLCCLSGAIALLALLDSYTLLPLLAIVLVGTFMYAHLPAYWPLPSMLLGPVTAASATGFINMVGNLGGFFGPVVVGTSSSASGSFAQAMLRLAPLPLCSACIILFLGFRWKLAATRQHAHTPAASTGSVIANESTA